MPIPIQVRKMCSAVTTAHLWFEIYTIILGLDLALLVDKLTKGIWFKVFYRRVIMHFSVHNLIHHNGYLGICVALLLEMLGVPFPGETILTLSGVES
jgi:hypothetical protein